MKTISRVFRYVLYFLQAETKELHKEAFEAAKQYYATKPLRTAKNPNPRVVEYNARREDFVAFQRGYINQRCHEIATAKLAMLVKTN